MRRLLLSYLFFTNIHAACPAIPIDSVRCFSRYEGVYDPCCKPAPCPQLYSDAHFFFGADLLIFTACQKGLQFLETLQLLDNDRERITLHSGDYGFDEGFRVWGGFKVDECCDYEAYLVYTWYSNDAKGQVTICPIQDVILENGLKYQVFDALFARNFSCACNNSFHPFFGFRALVLDQKYISEIVTKTSAKAPIQVNNSPCFPTEFISFDSSLCGVGLHGGAEYSFCFDNCIDFYSKGALSLLYGEMRNEHLVQRTIVTEETLLPVVVTDSITDEKCLPVLGYHLESGFRYECDYCRCGTDLLIRIDLGYEFHYWQAIPQIIREIDAPDFKSNSDDGNLLLHGVRIGIGLFF